MAEHVWKIGDWCQWGIGMHYVWKLCDFNGGVRLHLINCAGSTAYTIAEDTRLEHLPDCTGWDWQPPPKLQLREGAWYEQADGEVVGPANKRDTTTVPWFIGFHWYRDDGTTLGTSETLALIREVPAPAPKIKAPEGYRLLTEEETILHGDMFLQGGEWLKTGLSKQTVGESLRVYCRVGIIAYARKIEPKYRPFANAAEFKPHRDRWIRDKNNWAVRVNSLSHDGANGSSWHSLVNHWTFEDTGLPVGVEVQS